MAFQNMLLLLIAPVFYTAACTREGNSTPPQQQDTLAPFVRPVSPPIREASGMAGSKKHGEHLWVLEDSGNPPQLMLLNYSGNWQNKTYLSGATNRDWEAMASYRDTLYIGDIGDNAQAFNEYFIYRFAEPGISTDTVSTAEKIVFKYPDGAHDAEALFVDGGNVYIITKRDAQSGIYKIASPMPTGSSITATRVGSLAYNGVVDAAISEDGKTILVKTYSVINKYSRNNGEAVEAALQRQPVQLPYTLEPQGEAVALRPDGRGYFTLSEMFGNTAPQLYFYPLN